MLSDSEPENLVRSTEDPVTGMETIAHSVR
jgi:hypothetical protein